MAADGAEENYGSQGHNSFMVCHARVWSIAATIQLVLGNSGTIQFFNSEHSSTAKKILQADMQLS